MTYVLLLLWLPAADPSGQVVANVNGQAILMGEIDREVERALKGRTPPPDVQAQLRGHALEQLIRRRLVLSYLNRNGQGASADDVELRVEQIRRRLASRQRTLDEYLKKTRQTLDELQHRVAWKIVWPPYVSRQLTDKALEKYFQSHRRDFDGTQLRVSHILLSVRDDTVASSMTRAEAICQEIRSGKISFAEAARKHSTAPSAEDGGDVGFISRHDPMPESFSRPAFALEKDAVSDPVVTDFGVHLIQCTAVKPGEKTWQDVREPLPPRSICSSGPSGANNRGQGSSGCCRAVKSER